MVAVAMVTDVNFAFQPLLSTRTGGLVAVEALARPPHGSIGEYLSAAHRAGKLVPTDIALASRAVLAAAEHETLLPLHVNILAPTVPHAAELIGYLLPALRQSGRRPRDVVLEISGPFYRIRHDQFVAGVQALQNQGFPIAIDGVGDGDVPLSLLAEIAPAMVKLDRSVVAGIPDDAGKVALIEALAQLAGRTGSRLAAVGVESEDQLVALSRLGVRVAQGNLLAQV